MVRMGWVLAVVIAGCGGGGGATPMGDAGPSVSLGTTHDGQYNLGPVEWSEGTWHNACSPYPSSIQSLEGALLAGVSNGAGTGNYCDACVQVTTAMGRTLVARVVTYGVAMGPGDMDLSPEAYAMLDQGEYPRTMSWHLVSCPTTAPLYVQWQTGANPYWTSFWIRNPRLAIDHVSVTSTNHTSPITLMQGGDGTFTDASGFGMGSFTLTVVAVDGSSFSQTFLSFDPGSLVAASGNL
jgi:expansin (peptidoglycan-binding protein)